MAIHRLGEMTWPEVRALDRSRTLALLPAGAIEAHGPHLPVSTDVVIAEAMARAGAERLVERGWEALLLPPVTYTAAPFADRFAGTVSVRPETVTSLLVDLARSMADLEVRALVIANAHLDPTHIGSIRAAVEQWAPESRAGRMPILFPDVTRKPWALQLTEEFRSGACHAGRYEGSIVMAERGDLVRESLQRALAANPVSLARAIRQGKSSFEEAGGALAYFGDPAAATAAEGERTVATLGEIVADAVTEALTGTREGGAT